MGRTLTWLHLSDLHALKPTGWDSARILEKLCADLRRMEQDHGLRPDLIFFTGDAAFGHIGTAIGEKLQDQYVEAEKFFKSVRQAFSKEVPQSHFFIVPGNHDVNRKTVLPSTTEWLDRQRDVFVIADMIKSADAQWEQCVRRLEEYSQFLETAGYSHALTDRERAMFHSILTVNGVSVGIAGFNSAWSCCREYEIAKLWSGGIWQTAQFHRLLADTTISIALIHHPWNWFQPHEGRDLLHDIQRDFQFCLHGHEHRPWVEEITSCHVTISAGACYERSDKLSGYNFVRIFVDDGGGEVWLRKYDPTGGAWVPHAVADKTDNNGTWPLVSNPWRRANPTQLSSSETPDAGSLGTTDRLALVARDLKTSLQSGQPAVAADDVLGSASMEGQGEKTSRAYAPSLLEPPPDGNTAISTNIPATNPAIHGTAEPDAQLDRDIDDAAIPLKEWRPSIALDRLSQVERRYPHQLSAHARFRLNANRGHAYRMMQIFNLAADNYRMAMVAEPDNPEAKYLDVVAEFLSENVEVARTKAEALFSEPGIAVRCRALWLNTVPPGTFAELEATVPEEQRSDCEIAAALCHVATARSELEIALKYARLAETKDPSSPFFKGLLASALLNIELGRQTRYRATRPIDRTGVQKACELLQEVIKRQEEFAIRSSVAHNRAMLSTAYRLLGENEQSMVEIKIAVADSPSDPEIAYAYAGMLDAIERRSDAIDYLDGWMGKQHPVNLDILLATLLAVRRGPGDLDRAVAVLMARHADVKEESPPLRAVWSNAVVQLSVELKDAAKARTVLDSIPDDWLSADHRQVLIAEIYRVAGDENGARHAALLALAATKDSVDLRSVARVALLLEQLGDYANALSLWRRLAEPPSVSLESQHMLNCAQRCHKYDVIIEYCERLRKAGLLDIQYTKMELGALERSSPEDTLRVLRDLDSLPYPEQFKRELRAHLSILAISLGQAELAITDPRLLPSATEVTSPRLGRVVVEVLSRTDQLGAATFAYELFRRFPDDPDSYIAMLRGSGFPTSTELPWGEPTEVTVGTAVRYRHDDSKEEYWTIIEDLPGPKPSLNERAPDDPIARALANHKEGEVVTIREEPSSRTATIIKIISKLLYRTQWCLKEIEVRFPTESPLFSMTAVNTKTGEPDLGQLLEQIDRHSKHIDAVQKWYVENPVSLHMFGRQVGKTVFEVATSIATSDSMPLRSCRGSIEEYSRAADAIAGCADLVLDITALATLFSLSFGLDKIKELLSRLPKRLLVAEATVTELRQLLDERQRQTVSGYVGKAGGRYYLNETNAVELARSLHLLKSMVEMVGEICTKVPDSWKANISLSSHENLLEILGRSSVASIVLASEPDCALWTDDRTVGEIASTEFKVLRVWTQPVFHWLAATGRLDQQTDDEIAVGLVQMNYRHTALGAGAFLVAAEKAGWNPDAHPLRKMLDSLADQSVAEGGLYTLAIGVLFETWRRPLLENLKHLVTLRIASRLASLPHGRVLLETLHNDVDVIFGINVIAAAKVRSVVRGVLEVNASRIIIAP